MIITYHIILLFLTSISSSFYIHKTYDLIEGVQLKIPCAHIEEFVDNPQPPVMHDRRGNDFNIWTALPDKYPDGLCGKETVVAFNRHFPVSLLHVLCITTL